jgi:PPOX class probable F420-dependent enzyme
VPHDLDEARYIAFGTYRRDGSLVTTPTWIVPLRDGYAFFTDSTSHKVGRLQANPNVALSVSDISGATSDDALVHRATARLTDASTTDEIVRRIRKKYRFGYVLFFAVMPAWRRLRGQRPGPRVGVYLELAS